MNPILIASLEQCSENEGDIIEQVYERFFSGCQAAIPLMHHSDEHMKGRMLAQVFELLLDDDQIGEDGYLRWEVKNHLGAYGVDVSMYKSFLDALCETVKHSLGSAWTTSQASAWAERIDSLLQDIYSEARV